MDITAEDSEAIEAMTAEEIEALLEEFTESADENDLTAMIESMNQNQMIRWDEAERMLGDTFKTVVKSSLPETKPPQDDENETNVDDCVSRLLDKDTTLSMINLNNMKRVPIPQLHRLFEAVSHNKYLKNLSLCNLGLRDAAAEPLLAMLEENASLTSLNLETNYLSGDFLSRLLKSLLVNQTLESLKIANQGVACSQTQESDMANFTDDNETLVKIGYPFRVNENRIKVERAVIRNNEIRRLNRLEDIKLGNVKTDYKFDPSMVKVSCHVISVDAARRSKSSDTAPKEHKLQKQPTVDEEPEADLDEEEETETEKARRLEAETAATDADASEIEDADFEMDD